MTFDEQGAGVSPERARRGVIHRLAGNHILGLADVGDDGLQRQTHASGHAGQAEGRAHHSEETAARNRIDPLRGALGKFAVQGFLKRLACGKFFQAAPVFGAGFFGGVVRRRLVNAGAHRSQVELALLAGANVLAPGLVLLVHVHRTTFIAPRSLPTTRATVPSPLRGFPDSAFFSHGFRPWAAWFRRLRLTSPSRRSLHALRLQR
jgi:hypothetical protein